MTNQNTEKKPVKQLSIFRLRLGVFLFVLFWLPAYLLAPTVVAIMGLSGDQQAIQEVVIAILCIQGALGIMGFLLIGKTAAQLLRHSSYKKLPKLVWHLFWSGKLPEANDTPAKPAA